MSIPNQSKPYFDYKWKRPKSENFERSFSRVQLIKNSSTEWNFYANGFKKYISSHQELLTEKQIQEFEFTTKNLEAQNNYISYMNRPNALSKKDLNNQELIWKYSNKYIYDGKSAISNKTSKKSHIWSIIISEKDFQMGDIRFEHQHKIVDRYLRAIFDFPVNAVVSMHRNTNHPHIHIMAYQDVKTPVKQIKQFHKISKQKLTLAKKSYSMLLENNHKFFQKILDEKNKTQQSFKEHFIGEKLERYFFDEFKKLSEMNKFEFSRLEKPEKILVENLVKKILELPTNDKELQKFQQEYRHWNKVCDDSYLAIAKFKNKDNRTASFEKLDQYRNEVRIKQNNQILKTVKNYKFSKTDFSNQNTAAFMKKRLNFTKPKYVAFRNDTFKETANNLKTLKLVNWEIDNKYKKNQTISKRD